MADALTRWKERCLVPRWGRSLEQDGIALARSLAFQSTNPHTVLSVIESVAAKAANPAHRKGLYKALRWLREEIKRG